jgi:putative intracellular protease/amidase
VRRMLMLAALAVVALVHPTVEPLEGQESKILMVVKEGPSLDLELMLTAEVEVMRNILESSGFEVVVASSSGQPLVAGGTTVTPDIRLADADMDDYAGIILPCMATEDEASFPEAEALVREAVVAGKPVAAQTGSVITLARAGVLMGKKFAYPDDMVAGVPEFAGMNHAGQGVVRDGLVFTSGICPYMAREQGIEDGTQALTGAFIEKLWMTSMH